MQVIDFKALLFSQKKILDILSLDSTLRDSLDAICYELEFLLEPYVVTASIFLVRNNRLYFGGGPNVPESYGEALQGLEIGPNVGSCGTCAYTGQPVYISSISKSPEWADYKDLAQAFNFASCWSTPVMSCNKDVIGTFSVYSNQEVSPSQSQVDIINFFIHLTGLAIEKALAREREKILNKQLNATLNRMQAFGKVIPDLGIIFSDKGDYVDIYGHHDDLLYQPLHSVIGRNVKDVLPENIANDILLTIKKTLKTGDREMLEYELDVPKGTRTFESRTALIKDYNPDDRSQKHVVFLARDITERKNNELKIERLAFYDSLTNLPNRRLLMDRLDAVINKIQRNKQEAALIFIDLDNFKNINDSIGHIGGDKILREVSNKLNNMLRDSDTLARIGGDEFVVLIDASAITKSIFMEATRVCERIIGELKKPIDVQGGDVIVSASLGVTIIDGEVKSAKSVIEKADCAMYQAKASGKGQLKFFSDV